MLDVPRAPTTERGWVDQQALVVRLVVWYRPSGHTCLEAATDLWPIASIGASPDGSLAIKLLALVCRNRRLGQLVTPIETDVERLSIDGIVAHVGLLCV
jgi:hypothetical protein